MVDFQESLFGCFSDCKTCLWVAFVPCGSACVQGLAVAGAQAAGMQKPSCMTPCCLQLYLCCIGAAINRGSIRKGLGFENKCCLDFALHFFCMPCGVCQEKREVVNGVIEKGGEAVEAMAGAIEKAQENAD